MFGNTDTMTFVYTEIGRNSSMGYFDPFLSMFNLYNIG